jgi:hypothetical protein
MKIYEIAKESTEKRLKNVKKIKVRKKKATVKRSHDAENYRQKIQRIKNI